MATGSGPAPTITSPERPGEETRDHVVADRVVDDLNQDAVVRVFISLKLMTEDEGRSASVLLRALRGFQAKFGIPVNGDFDDPKTQKALRDAIAYNTAANTPVGGEREPSEAGGNAAGPSGSDLTDRVPANVTPSGAAPGTSSASTTPGVQGPTGYGATSPTAGATAGGAPNPDGLFTIPGGAEIWQTPDGWMAVYKVPGSTTPLVWKIEGEDDLAAIFGPGNPPKASRTLNAEEWGKAGALVFGSSRLLGNLSEHPFDAFVANFQTEARIRPWMRDPEILALTGRALLEGRDVTEAELATTKWWQTHTDGERAWMAESNKDPKTAAQKVTDRRNAVKASMIASGISDPPDKLVKLIADRITGGTWTEAYANTQIMNIADPASPGELDPTAAIWVSDLTKSGVKLNTLTDNTTKVEQLVKQALGPVYAAGWTKDQKEMWAGRLRNDPQAEQELIDELKRQRLALFPEYENADLTYEDIAAPWRGVWTQMWGQAPDETDPLFSQVVRANDLAAASEILRREGLKRGNGTVANSLIGAVGRSDLGAGAVRGTV